MSNAIVSQVPKNLSFRYRIPCRRFDGNAKATFELPEDYRLPYFGDLEKQIQFADVRAGWNEDGFFLWAEVKGKSQTVWCRESQLLESDGLQVWIDTRDTHNVHRASKFCHWILILPTGGGSSKNKPLVSRLKINRSREASPNINRGKILASSKTSKTGYRISCHIPAECMYGWNTDDHRNIGFNYALVDRELGWQTLALGPTLPISEDPSLWQTLSLSE